MEMPITMLKKLDIRSMLLQNSNIEVYKEDKAQTTLTLNRLIQLFSMGVTATKHKGL